MVKDGSPVVVVVTVRNVGEHRRALLPGFRLTEPAQPRLPIGRLSFSITDSLGVELARSAWIVDEAIGELDPRTFRVLIPGGFFGNSIRLDGHPLNYRFERGRLYSVRARLAHRVGSWLPNTLVARQVEDSQLHYDLESVFEGEVESNTITIEVK